MTANKHFGLFTATSIVMASMIGTGAFTSLGFQAQGIRSGFALLAVWAIGGLVALAGAFCYAELSALYPRSGGEYNFLTNIYHPSVGFLAGFVSATVGFAAPIAASSIALGHYMVNVFPGLSPTLVAGSVVVGLTLVHATQLKAGRHLQNLLSATNVVVILAMIVFGVLRSGSGDVNYVPTYSSMQDMMSPAFGIALYFVAFSYSGWNAATYLAGEIHEPRKNVPRALVMGTLIVMILYIMLNFVFLQTVPIGDMADANGNPVVDIGALSAERIFGSVGGRIFSAVICGLLLSAISSMLITGPRVLQVMGEDFRLFRAFSKRNKNMSPTLAVLAQGALALFFLATSTFESVITYIGFTLSLFTFMTVSGLLILRLRRPELVSEYRVIRSPVAPIVFLVMDLWILIFGLLYKPYESGAGLLTVAIGALVYVVDARMSRKKSDL